MAKKKQRSTYQDEANLQALLKYGPQVSALTDAVRAAQTTYGGQISAANTNAASITNAVNQTVPQVQGFYAQNAQDRGQDQSTLNQSLQGLQGANPTVLAAIAAEQSRAKRLSGDTQADYLSNLATQKTGAAAGKVFAKQKAQSDLAGSLQQILQKQQDIAQEQGTFTALTAQQLQDKADQQAATFANQEANRQQSNTNSIRASGTDPVTGLPTVDAQNSSKSAKSGNQWVTKNQQVRVSNTVQGAVQTAKQFKTAGVSMDDAIAALTKGRKASSEERVPLHDQNGKPIYNPDGTPKTKVLTPARSGIDAVDALYAKAAAEQAYQGYISRDTQKQLQANGIKITPLGVTSFGKRRRVAANQRIANNSTGSGLIP